MSSSGLQANILEVMWRDAAHMSSVGKTLEILSDVSTVALWKSNQRGTYIKFTDPTGFCCAEIRLDSHEEDRRLSTQSSTLPKMEIYVKRDFSAKFSVPFLGHQLVRIAKLKHIATVYSPHPNCLYIRESMITTGQILNTIRVPSEENEPRVFHCISTRALRNRDRTKYLELDLHTQEFHRIVNMQAITLGTSGGDTWMEVETPSEKSSEPIPYRIVWKAVNHDGATTALTLNIALDQGSNRDHSVELVEAPEQSFRVDYLNTFLKRIGKLFDHFGSTIKIMATPHGILFQLPEHRLMTVFIYLVSVTHVDLVSFGK